MVCRLGGYGAPHVLQCSRCCLTVFREMPVWETTLERCVTSQLPVLGMSFQDWQPISLVGRRLVPSAPAHSTPTR